MTVASLYTCATVTTVAAMAMDLPEYDAAVLHGAVIDRT